VASGGKPDLRSGEEKLPVSQAGASHAYDAPGDTSKFQNRLAGTGSLWTTQYCFHRAGESDRPSWSGSSRKTYLGHSTAVSTPLGPPRVVAGILSFCASPRIAAGDAHAASRTRGQAGSATLPAAYLSHGSRENQPTVDSKGSAVLSHATSATLRMVSLNEVRKRPCNGRKRHLEDESRCTGRSLG
jgi:hypothetical protein